MTSSDLPSSSLVSADLEPGVHRLVAGVDTGSLLASLRHAGWATAAVDLRCTADKPTILEAFARDLDFPAWVGRNWDALDDALGDLSWWPAGARGRVILVRGISAHLPAGDLEVAHDVLATATAAWADRESPLVVLLHDADPDSSAGSSPAA